MLPLFGRILFALIFLISGIQKIVAFGAHVAYMRAYSMPWAPLFLVGAIAVEIGGGLLLVLGFRTRWAAVLLFLFLIPATLLFHTDFGEPQQGTSFLKNLAIMGGLLFVAHAGPGPVSLDARTQQQRAPRTLPTQPPA